MTDDRHRTRIRSHQRSIERIVSRVPPGEGIDSIDSWHIKRHTRWIQRLKGKLKDA